MQTTREKDLKGLYPVDAETRSYVNYLGMEYEETELGIAINEETTNLLITRKITEIVFVFPNEELYMAKTIDFVLNGERRETENDDFELIIPLRWLTKIDA